MQSLVRSLAANILFNLLSVGHARSEAPQNAKKGTRASTQKAMGRYDDAGPTVSPKNYTTFGWCLRWNGSTPRRAEVEQRASGAQVGRGKACVEGGLGGE